MVCWLTSCSVRRWVKNRCKSAWKRPDVINDRRKFACGNRRNERSRSQCRKLVLNIPIGLVKMLMSQIARQHHEALRDRIGLAAPTADKGGGKGMAKII